VDTIRPGQTWSGWRATETKGVQVRVAMYQNGQKPDGSDD
jgi:hypothetical protein